jgi:dephospho-CoA kinase
LEIQRNRMKKRDSFSDEQIDHRLQNQVSKEERTK